MSSVWNLFLRPGINFFWLLFCIDVTVIVTIQWKHTAIYVMSSYRYGEWRDEQQVLNGA